MTFSLSAYQVQVTSGHQNIPTNDCVERVSIVSDHMFEIQQFQKNVAFVYKFAKDHGQKVDHIFMQEDGNCYPTLQWTLTKNLFPNLTSLEVIIVPRYTMQIPVEPLTSLTNLKTLHLYSSESIDSSSLKAKAFAQWIVRSTPFVEQLKLFDCLDLVSLTKVKSLCLEKNIGGTYDPKELQMMLNSICSTLETLQIEHNCIINEVKFTAWKLPVMAVLKTLKLASCIEDQLSSKLINYSTLVVPKIQQLVLSNQELTFLHVLREEHEEEKWVEYQLNFSELVLVGVSDVTMLGFLSHRFNHLVKLTVEFNSNWLNGGEYYNWDVLWTRIENSKLTQLTLKIPSNYNYETFIKVFDVHLPQFLNSRLMKICIQDIMHEMLNRSEENVHIEMVQDVFFKLRGHGDKIQLIITDWMIPAITCCTLQTFVQLQNLPITFSTVNQ